MSLEERGRISMTSAREPTSPGNGRSAQIRAQTIDCFWSK